jgi:nitrite reductase/ring-hydroxylating ferredoxin subunit
MYAMLEAPKEALSDLVGRGRVHRRFYTGPAVFEEEKARIFRRVWLWLGHESQLKAPGDFFTTRMAGDRVIVARHADGKIHAFHNRCAHRGAEVCAASSGNARNLSNLMVEDAEGGELVARAHLLFAEYRTEEQRWFAGRSTWRLRPRNASYQIAAKRVDLLNADQDSGHLRFAIPF